MLEAWFSRIGSEKEDITPGEDQIEILLARIHSSARFRESPSETRERNRIRRLFTAISIAAMTLLVCGLTFYTVKQYSTNENIVSTDVSPGGDKAFLTLSTGKKISLNESSGGTVATQSGLDIIQTAAGTIIYSLRDGHLQHGVDAGSNTIETPRGGQFQAVLPDGTTVWLNASSSLTFPVHFSSTERRLKVSGEVYFDVATRYYPGDKKKRVPFIVETSHQIIEVLGTQFNVHNYPDEPESITLVEGRVKLVSRANGRQILLKPGQQAKTGSHTEIAYADIEKTLAWKNGDFIFKNENLADILQQVSRWYDIGFSCPDPLTKREFSGMISRKQPLSSIISMLESTGTVKVKLKDRRAIVTEQRH